MPGRSFRIGRIAGIPVGVSPLWLVIVALITWSLGAGYFPEAVHGISTPGAYALGLASALLLFASILAHEFGHALVARRRGIEVEEIDLWLLGGVSRLRGEAHAPGDELRFALAGPAVSAVLGACFGLATILLPASTPAALSALIGGSPDDVTANESTADCMALMQGATWVNYGCQDSLRDAATAILAGHRP